MTYTSQAPGVPACREVVSLRAASRSIVLGFCGFRAPVQFGANGCGFFSLRKNFLHPLQLSELDPCYPSTMSLKTTLFASLILSVTSGLFADVSRSKVAEFPVKPGTSVDVRLAGAAIEVRVGAQNKINVEFVQSVDAANEAEAEALFTQLGASAAVKGKVVTVSLAKDAYNKKNDLTKKVHLKAIVTVPATVNLTLETSGAPIVVGLDPAGGYNIDADSDGGSVKVSKLRFKGERVNLSHAEGSINHGGTRIRADVTGGDIVIAGSQS